MEIEGSAIVSGDLPPESPPTRTDRLGDRVRGAEPPDEVCQRIGAAHWDPVQGEPVIPWGGEADPHAARRAIARLRGTCADGGVVGAERVRQMPHCTPQLRLELGPGGGQLLAAS